MHTLDDSQLGALALVPFLAGLFLGTWIKFYQKVKADENGE